MRACIAYDGLKCGRQVFDALGIDSMRLIHWFSIHRDHYSKGLHDTRQVMNKVMILYLSVDAILRDRATLSIPGTGSNNIGIIHPAHYCNTILRPYGNTCQPPSGPPSVYANLHTRIILQFIVLSLANIDRAVDHTVDKPSASSYVIA